MVQPVNNQAIHGVLAQMRAAAQEGVIKAPGIQAPEVKPTEKAQAPDFAQMVAGALEGVSRTQSTAAQQAAAFERGDPSVSLPQVMVALEKASVSFEGVKQVRNRMVAAYQEIMNMPI